MEEKIKAPLDSEAIEAKVKKIKDEVKDIVNIDEVEKLIQNNEIEFTLNDILYKVVKPTFQQKKDVNQERIKKYTEMLQVPTNLLEADLIKLYKKRGIDVAEMDKADEAIEKKRNSLMEKLGKMIAEDKIKSEIDKLKEEVKSLIAQQQETAMRRAILLDSSIETQVNVHVYTYIAYLITEKKQDDKWIKAWKSFDEFMLETEDTVNQTVWYSTLIYRN